MQTDDERIIHTQKKELLLKVLGEIINFNRQKQHKGINIFSYEFDIGNGLISNLEKGKIDTRITTLWKLANAFGYKCSDFIKLIETKLPDDFNFYN